MRIGHINLSRSFDGPGKHFVSLVESLERKGIAQHVIVRNAVLAKRIDEIEHVVVGPITRSAVGAYCLMPCLDLVHVHDADAAQAGLLLTLTKSIPFVLTHRGPPPTSKNPLTQAVYRRASSIICMDDSDVALLHHFDPLLRVRVVPDLDSHGSAYEHIRVYQNSQRMPMAGSNGIQ